MTDNPQPRTPAKRRGKRSMPMDPNKLRERRIEARLARVEALLGLPDLGRNEEKSPLSRTRQRKLDGKDSHNQPPAP